MIGKGLSCEDAVQKKRGPKKKESVGQTYEMEWFNVCRLQIY